MSSLELIALLRLRLRQIEGLDVTTPFGQHSLQARLTSLPEELSAYSAADGISQRMQELATRQLPAQELQLRLSRLLVAALIQLPPLLG